MSHAWWLSPTFLSDDIKFPHFTLVQLRNIVHEALHCTSCSSETSERLTQRGSPEKGTKAGCTPRRPPPWTAIFSLPAHNNSQRQVLSLLLLEEANKQRHEIVHLKLCSQQVTRQESEARPCLSSLVGPWKATVGHSSIGEAPDTQASRLCTGRIPTQEPGRQRPHSEKEKPALLVWSKDKPSTLSNFRLHGKKHFNDVSPTIVQAPPSPPENIDVSFQMSP